MHTQPEIAVRVLALLENGAFDVSEPQDDDLLPSCVNKFSIMSRDYLIKLLLELNPNATAEWKTKVNHIRKKADVCQVVAMAINAEVACAVPSRSFRTLVLRCRMRMGNVETLQKLAFKEEPGKGGTVVDFAVCGVFAFQGWSEEQQRFKEVVHRKTGHAVDIPEELVVSKAFTIVNNYSEREAQCKGSRICDYILPWFAKDGVSAKKQGKPDKEVYGFELPIFEECIPEPLNTPRKGKPGSAGSGASSSRASEADAETGGDASPPPPSGWGGASVSNAQEVAAQTGKAGAADKEAVADQKGVGEAGDTECT